METPLLTRNAKLLLIGLVIAAAVLYLLRGIVAPVAFSFLLAYFLDPLVDRLEARKLSRSLSIVLILVAALLAIGLFLLILLPLLKLQIGQFAARLPGLVDGVEGRIAPWLEQTFGVKASVLLDQSTTQIGSWLHGLTAGDMAPVTEVLARFSSGTVSLVMAVVSAAVIPVFLFYFLRDFDTLKLIPLEYVPPRYTDWVVELFCEIDETLAGFVRGQVTVCLLLSGLYGVGFFIAGVPLGLPIGILAGLVAFVPYLGAVFGVGVSVIMILLDWQGFGPLIGLGIVFALVQTLESFILTPRIVGGKVGLSPVAVIVALMVGGQLLGFAGILVAVPAAAVVKILWRRSAARYRESAFFSGG